MSSISPSVFLLLNGLCLIQISLSLKSTLTEVNRTISPRSLPLVLLIVSYFLSSFKWHRFEPYLRNIQPIYKPFIVPEGAYLGKELKTTCTKLHIMQHLPMVWLWGVLLQMWPLSNTCCNCCFWKGATCLHKWEFVRACDQPVVKSHFSGILHFIVHMTSSKIRSPQ